MTWFDNHPSLIGVALLALIAATALAWALGTGQRPSLAADHCSVVPATAAPPVEFEDGTP